MVGVEFQLHAEIKEAKEHSMLAPVETSTPMLPFRGFLIPRHQIEKKRISIPKTKQMKKLWNFFLR